MVAALGVGYAGIVVTTLVQALRGRPLLSPDAVTIALAAVVAGITFGGILLARGLPVAESTRPGRAPSEAAAA